MSIILSIAIIINVSNRELELISNIFETYLFQYFVSTSNNAVIREIIRNIVINPPPIFITSGEYTEFDMMLIQTTSIKVIFQITLYL